MRRRNEHDQRHALAAGPWVGSRLPLLMIIIFSKLPCLVEAVGEQGSPNASTVSLCNANFSELG